MIAANVDDRYPPLIAVEGNQALINIAARDFSFIAEHHLRYLFQQIADHRLQVNLMQNTALNFSISVNDIDQRVEDFAKAIETEFQVVIDRGLELLTCRHFTEDTVENLKRGKIVFAEARIPQTIQLVVRDVPNMVRREVPLPSAKGL
jgi:aspartate kinase